MFSSAKLPRCVVFLLGVAGDGVEQFPKLRMLDEDIYQSSVLSLYSASEFFEELLADRVWWSLDVRLLFLWHEAVSLLDELLCNEGVVQLGLPALCETMLFCQCVNVLLVLRKYTVLNCS